MSFPFAKLGKLSKHWQTYIRVFEKYSIYQVGHLPTFGKFISYWWLNAWMVYLFRLPNGTQFSFISAYVFLVKKCIMFTNGASTLSDCFIINHSFKKNCVSIFARVFKKSQNEMHSGRQCFSTSKIPFLFNVRYGLIPRSLKI